MEKFKEYEKLAECIYVRISPGSVVKHNDHIIGHDSGIPRQIDISIRSSVGPHEVLIVVQCKNQARKIDVNTIGELVAVIRDVRASKGILVANSGFTESARTMAASSNIDLCSLHDALSRNWKLDIRLPLVARSLTPYFLVTVDATPDEYDHHLAAFAKIAYGSFYRLICARWAAGDLLDLTMGQHMFADLQPVVGSIVPADMRRIVGMHEAGFIISEDKFAGFIDALPSAKGIYNLSTNRYLVTVSVNERVAMQERDRPMVLDDVPDNNTIVYTCIEEPLLGHKRGPNNRVDGDNQ